MKSPLPKIIVVAGPTATGKTAYAIELAKKICGEVVSADSRQVYRGIDLLSGKVTPEEMAGVPHHMLDVASPKRIFTVAQYQKQARAVIKDILSRGKTPIICGGTGFYINAIVFDLSFPSVRKNIIERKKLSKKSASELFDILKKLDPARAKTIDKANPVRLIRAIEIATELGSVPELTKPEPVYDAQWIIVDREDDELKRRIHARLLSRIAEGMLEEAKKLHDSGVSYTRMETLGLECRTTARFLQNHISKDELIEELDRDIWQYVKRQRTWFKRTTGFQVQRITLQG